MKYTFSKKRFWLSLSSLLILVSLVFALQSCYPGDEITPADTDIVATFYDKAANFDTKLTYAIRDSITRLDEDGNPVFEAGPYDAQIINKIKTNLDNTGFTEVANPSDADVIVFVAANNSTWVSGGCYSWWYSWYYPYYGWCYPVYYTYETGTLIIVMLDANATEQKDALWVATINGILEDSSAGILDRVYKGIDQAFTQSPYLGEGK
jgi:Domain of unknown function (DUF4136)